MTDYASLSDYSAQRAALINEDRSLRRENLTKHLRSEAEIQADAILRKIRADEAKTIWGVEHPDIPHPFPGMEFLTGKSIIVTTKVFEILSKMPKGGLLHAHLDATVDAAILLKLALKYPVYHVRVEQALTKSNLSTVLPQFQALPREEWTSVPSLTEEGYPLGAWVPLSSARESFSPELGGPAGFDAWVIGALTINPEEAYETYNTAIKIWEKFVNTFITGRYMKEFFRSAVADGISYIEARVNFALRHVLKEDARESISHSELVQTFIDAVHAVKTELTEQGRPNAFIGAKIIYTAVRNITPQELTWYTEDCLSLKKEFPSTIVGFDLVGHEDTLQPLIYYLETLLKFKERQKEEGIDIPFLFHAGETFGDGTEADENLYDAILLGTKRIGHGFAMAKHPKLMQICREKGIALEVCPISNEILRLTSSMPTHPLPIVMNNGVAVALSSDDPSAFGNMGLTYDYFQVFVASEVTGLSTLGALARDSIEVSEETAE